jgi:hypothetical protein
MDVSASARLGRLKSHIDSVAPAHAARHGDGSPVTAVSRCAHLSPVTCHPSHLSARSTRALSKACHR